MNFFQENLSDSPIGLIEKLINFATEHGYDTMFSRRQRIFFKPEAPESPTKGCEIFIRKIPSDVCESDIIPVFERCGEISQFRLILEYNKGFHRGFGFLSYTTSEAADKAVRTLNKFPIRCEKYIGVYKSLNNRRLFVRGIPQDVTEDDVKAALANQVVGIETIIMYRSREDKEKNRGYVFVEFQNRNLAAIAKKKLAEIQLWGERVNVDWADPIPEIDPENMKQIKNLFIRNLSLDLTLGQLNFVLKKYISSGNIIKTFKRMDFAFVHFVDRNSAEEALEILQGLKIDGEPIEVSWARPVNYAKRNRRNLPFQDLCAPLPPIIQQVRDEVIRYRVNCIPRPQSYANISISPNHSDRQSFVGLINDYPGSDFSGSNFTPMGHSNIPQQLMINPYSYTPGFAPPQFFSG